MISKVLEIGSYTRLTSIKFKRFRNTSIIRLEESEDLNIFSELAYRNIGVRFPINFLRRSKTFAVINQRGNICGGFVLAPGDCSRVIESLPEKGLEVLRANYPNYIENMFEITGLWLCRSQRSKTLAIRFWTKLYKEVSSMKRSHFIYAYSSKKTKLGEIYSVVKPQKIFVGFTKLMPGMTETDHEVIEVGSVKMAHVAWLTQLSFFYRRLTKGRSKVKRVVYQ